MNKGAKINSKLPRDSELLMKIEFRRINVRRILLALMRTVLRNVT